MTCWSCSKNIDPADNFCRHCGRGQGKNVPWYYQHWGIIVSALGLGPFVLVLVWRSPRLSKEARWVYTALVALITWYAAVQTYNLFLLIKNTMGAMTQGLQV